MMAIMIKQDIIIQCLDALLKNRKVEYWDNRANNYKKTTDPERIKECVEFKVPLKISYTKPLETVSEFIKEAKKHDCFGYLRDKTCEDIVHIGMLCPNRKDNKETIFWHNSVPTNLPQIVKDFTFLDGQPVVRSIEIEFKDKDYD